MILVVRLVGGKAVKKFVEDITSIDDDFAKWYTDIVVKAELLDYSSVRGLYILRPYGFAIWENITKVLDKKFKDLGVENVSMPLLIPESLLQKEKDHVEGFAPEVAWVTHGGNDKLSERLCVRPTSEVLFCSHFKHIVQSWRDLPKIYNQWCSVMRWEKTSRPFLRSVEFHWQEGHTVHSTPDEAKNLTLRMLKVYADFFEKVLRIPIILGKKTESEKFAGALDTYTVECMMKDGKALQSATSHYFGQGFSKAFEVQFTNKNNQLEYPYQTSWGLSTRVIASIIMTHGDHDGLVLPPDIAPIQIVIIPINMQSAGVKDKSFELFNLLKNQFRVKIDESDQSPGWKFSYYEMKGVPIRIEIGPNDIQNNSCVIVRRDNRFKEVCSLDNILECINLSIENMKCDMYNSANDFKNSHIAEVTSIDKIDNHIGFIKMPFCESSSCEQFMKERFSMSARCIPLDDNEHKSKCAICGNFATHDVYFAKAY